jgi:hypothetical protein
MTTTTKSAYRSTASLKLATKLPVLLRTPRTSLATPRAPVSAFGVAGP